MTAYNQTKLIFDNLKPLKEKFKDDVLFLSAGASPHTRLKNKYRFQVLMRFTNLRKDDIIEEIYKVVNTFSDKKCGVFVEINPSSLA